MKGDKYSLSEIRFQSEQVESSWSSGLLYLHVGQGRFLTMFGSLQDCHGLGRHDFFTTLMMEVNEFYYVNECIMYLEVKSGPTSPPGLTDLLSIPHSISHENSLYRMYRM